MEPVWSSLLLLRSWMGHGYTAIQVVYWVELPEQMRLCLIFVKIWIPINWTQQCGIGLLETHRNFGGLTGCQRDPQVLGSHNLTFLVQKRKL